MAGHGYRTGCVMGQSLVCKQVQSALISVRQVVKVGRTKDVEIRDLYKAVITYILFTTKKYYHF